MHSACVLTAQRPGCRAKQRAPCAHVLTVTRSSAFCTRWTAAATRRHEQYLQETPAARRRWPYNRGVAG
eukprot:11715414-Alexandrium_andersonii.AAC.1